MNVKKEQVDEAILYFAKKFDQEENYKAIMSTYCTTPKIIEMIVYTMFLHKFNPFNCTEEQQEQYKIIYEYATELKENGWVEFK